MRYRKRVETERLDSARIKKIAARFKLHESLAGLLASRGVDTPEKVDHFLHPCAAGFHDPMLLAGMGEAAARIRLAVERGESVVVFGDYDADGVCAAAMLCDFLTGKGLHVDCYIPEREDGYGLTEEAVEFIMEEFSPDLVITVDCGISCKAETEYVFDLGSDVIVTDHHQIPEEVPSCITVDPWLAGQEYPFQPLCGAGVALKLIQALDPEAANEYLDLAALATIADNVPLEGENRDIVALGLARMNEGGRECFSVYRRVAGKERLSAEDVAYYLAPCVNAAGRYDKASHAFHFLLGDAPELTERLAQELLLFNDQRKRDTAAALDRIREHISRRKMFTERAIAVVDERVSHGIAGIVAAKLAEEYRRPAFVFTKDGEGGLKGSGRSVPGVDLYGLLAGMGELFTAFGGHAQAAGLSLLESNLPVMKKRLAEALAAYPPEAFLPEREYDLDFSPEYADLDYIAQLDRLEPFGYGFPRPVYRMGGEGFSFVSLKKDPRYLRIKTKVPGFSPMCFSGDRYADVLDSGMPASMLFQLKIHTFKGVSSPDASLECIFLDEEEGKTGDSQTAYARFLEQLYYPPGGTDSLLVLKEPDYIAALDHALASLYGVAVVCNTPEGAQFFREKLYPNLTRGKNLVCTDWVRPAAGGSPNTQLVAASANLDYGAFTDVFVVDRPLNPGFWNAAVEKYETNVCLLEDPPDTWGFLDGIRLERDVFARYFRLVKRTLEPGACALDYYRWYHVFKAADPGIELSQFITCMFVFNDLGILKLDKKSGAIVEDPTKSGNIADSKFYQRVKQAKEARASRT